MPGCAMGNCRNYSSKSKGQGIIYHSFPHDPKRAKLWILKCRRKDKINVKTASVCSEHFSPDDYMRDLKAELLGCKPRKVLKPTAVPQSELPSKFSALRTRREKSKLSHKNLCVSSIKTNLKVEESSNDSITLNSASPIKEVTDTSSISLSSSVVNNPLVIKLNNNTTCNLPLKKMLKSRVEAATTPNCNNVSFDINSNETTHSAPLGVNNSAEEPFSNNENINGLTNSDYTQSTPIVLKEETSSNAMMGDSTDVIFECSSVDIVDEMPEKYFLSLTPFISKPENHHSCTEQAIKITDSDACDYLGVIQDQVQTSSTSANPENQEQGINCINIVKNNRIEKTVLLPPRNLNVDLGKVANSTAVDSQPTFRSLKHDVTTAIGLLMDQSVESNEPITESNDIVIDESEDQIPEELYAKDRRRKEKTHHHKSVQTVSNTFDPKFLINRIKWLEHKVQTLNNAVVSRDARIKNLRSLMAASKRTVNNKVHEILGKLFTPSQIHCLETGRKCRNWNPETLNQAVALHSISKKAYIFLRKTMGFPFPGLTSIKRWIRTRKRMEKEQKISQMVIKEENPTPATISETLKKECELHELKTECELHELTIEITTAAE